MCRKYSSEIDLKADVKILCSTKYNTWQIENQGIRINDVSELEQSFV